MSETTFEGKISQLSCCPELSQRPVCDTLNMRYRLPFRRQIRDSNVTVEVILYFRFERCSGSLVLGDPIYSTTLLPGERVRLFTSDRHTRWSYDSESSLSYRHETTSVDAFLTAGMAEAMSDLTINESGSGRSTYEESWAEGGGGASFSLFGLIEIGGGGGGGSYDSESTYSFSRSLSRHAESASRYVAAGVRAKSATSIGEVEQRAHAEGESEAHYESSSRLFSNPNKCHAVTYFFYKLNKVQRISFKLVAIERRVEDPRAPTGAAQRIPVDTTGRITVLPQAIAATHKDRLDIEQMAYASAVTRHKNAASAAGLGVGDIYYSQMRVATPIITAREPILIDDRRAALLAVDQELIDAGILDEKTKEPSKKLIAELSWERKEILPTPGVIVKGCLDECNTCEPALQDEIGLDLERRKLENDLLKRQIELLEQSQEYRCCPGGEDDDEED